MLLEPVSICRSTFGSYILEPLSIRRSTFGSYILEPLSICRSTSTQTSRFRATANVDDILSILHHHWTQCDDWYPSERQRVQHAIMIVLCASKGSKSALGPLKRQLKVLPKSNAVCDQFADLALDLGMTCRSIIDKGDTSS